MTISLDRLIRQLSASGLLPDDEIAAFFDGTPAKRRPKDGQQMALELVRRKRLTKFQARLLCEGKAKDLVLGNYVLLDAIGIGGMGQVFKAEHRRMKRIVALKVLSPEVTKNPEALHRFQREVLAAARLSHQNIVTAYDADEHNGRHFLVMQYVAGSDLFALVKRRGPLSVSQAADCVVQAARGLEYAHQKGIVHRDVKPSNLLLDGEGVVRMLDLGLVRIEGMGDSAAEELDLTGVKIMGTVDYMSPEQALDTTHADRRTDIYGLGCTFFFLLTGRTPFQDKATAMQKLIAHREEPAPSLKQLNSAIPEAVDAVFQKMVAKRSEERFQSMGEVIAALQLSIQRAGIDPQAAPLPESPADPAAEDDPLQDFLRNLSDADSDADSDAVTVAVGASDTAAATGSAVAQRSSRTRTGRAPAAGTKQKANSTKWKLGAVWAALVLVAVSAGAWGVIATGLGSKSSGVAVQSSGSQPAGDGLQEQVADAGAAAQGDSHQPGGEREPTTTDPPDAPEQMVSADVPPGRADETDGATNDDEDAPVQRPARPPVVAGIPDQVARPGTELRVGVTAAATNQPDRELRFSLGAGAPEGARIDEKTGEFVWKIDADQQPRLFLIPVQVAFADAPQRQSVQYLTVRVETAEPASDPMPRPRPFTPGPVVSIPKTGRQPVPSDEQQQEAEQSVKKVFQEELGRGRGSAERSQRARRLLKRASEIETEQAAMAFVLHRYARDEALKAQDYETALASIRATARRFDVDEIALTAEVLQGLRPGNTTLAARQAVCETGILLASQAVEQDRFDEAGKLLGWAETTARVDRDLEIMQLLRKTDGLLKTVRRSAESDPAAAQLAKQELVELLQSHTFVPLFPSIDRVSFTRSTTGNLPDDGRSYWTIDDGTVQLESPAAQVSTGFLDKREAYDHFVLRAQLPPGNTAGELLFGEPDDGILDGLRLNLRPGSKFCCLLPHNSGEPVASPSAAPARNRNGDDVIELRVRGRHVTLVFNGRTIIDGPVRGKTSGLLGVSMSLASEQSKARFHLRNVRIRKLPAPDESSDQRK